MRFGIRRSAVAPSDASQKTAQLRSLTCIGCFGKFTSCMTFGALKLVHSEPFWDWPTYTNFDNALYSDMREKIYIGAHLHSRP